MFFYSILLNKPMVKVLISEKNSFMVLTNILGVHYFIVSNELVVDAINLNLCVFCLFFNFTGCPSNTGHAGLSNNK